MGKWASYLLPFEGSRTLHSGPKICSASHLGTLATYTLAVLEITTLPGDEISNGPNLGRLAT